MAIDVTPARTISLSERVAEEIRVILARRKMRQSQLARIIGANEQWVSVRLRGIQPIDLNDLERFARALGVSVTELLPRSTLVVDPPIGHTGPPVATVRTVPPGTYSRPKGRPDQATPNGSRPGSTRPSGHPKFPVLPPMVRRPSPRDRVA